MHEFEFKGVKYVSTRDSFGIRVRPAQLPLPTPKSKEVIPDHLRLLNKRQLRARIIELENNTP
jgi:hypothetical protein